MDKNVTGIDLEELKAAREEMYRDMGISPPEPVFSNNNSKTEKQVSSTESTTNSSVDDNMEDFDLEIERLLKEIEDFDVSNDSSGEKIEDQSSEVDTDNISDVVEEVDAVNIDDIVAGIETLETENKPAKTEETRSQNAFYKKDLSHYDAFAQYEINSPENKNTEITENILQSNEISNDMISMERADNFVEEVEQINQEADIEQEKQLSNELVVDEILDEIKEFNFDEIIEEEVAKELAKAEELNKTLENAETEDENIDDNLESQKSQETEKIEEIEQTQVENNEDIEETSAVQAEIVDENADEEVDNQQDIINISIIENAVNDENEVQEQVEEKIDIAENENQEQTEKEEIVIENQITPSVNKYEAISDEDFNAIVQAKRNELKIRKAEMEQIKKQPELFPEIEPVNFVNVLSMQDFKLSDNFTFVLGRSSSGNVLFESLKQSYNIAFFANENSYEMLNSMLLSFMLKNSATDFKMALCDGATKHNFNYYEESKYLLAPVAKNEDDIFEVLAKVVSELEDRYRILAKYNVRSIDEYNILAKSTQKPKLSQILVVIDGYAELMLSSNFEKIKSELYQILRLGRIAGIYAIIVTDRKINEDIINFNLPSRIAFNCGEHNDSIAMIGESGIEKLSNKNEYLYSSIHSEKAEHIRQPMISDAIIKILINNIEQ